MLSTTRLIVLMLSLFSFLLIGCKDTLDEELQDPIEQEEEEEQEQEQETQKPDSSVVDLPCQLISYTYREDDRVLYHELEIEGSKLVKRSDIITDGTDEAIIETVIGYDGYDITSFELKMYLNGEPYTETETDQEYYLVDSENGILNSLTHVEKYSYEGVYYTSVTKEEYAYEGSNLVNVKFSYVDASGENDYPNENTVDLFLSSEEVYTYNSAGNLVKEEDIEYSSKSTPERVRRSKTQRLLAKHFNTEQTKNAAQRDVTKTYTYQHDDKLNPFSGLNVASLAILNWGYLFDASQLLSTNNLISGRSSQPRPDSNASNEIAITFSNTYNSSDLLEGMTRDYRAVYTDGDYTDVIESQYNYEFEYSCE